MISWIQIPVTESRLFVGDPFWRRFAKAFLSSSEMGGCGMLTWIWHAMSAIKRVVKHIQTFTMRSPRSLGFSCFGRPSPAIRNFVSGWITCGSRKWLLITTWSDVGVFYIWSSHCKRLIGKTIYSTKLHEIITRGIVHKKLLTLPPKIASTSGICGIRQAWTNTWPALQLSPSQHHLLRNLSCPLVPKQDSRWHLQECSLVHHLPRTETWK